MKPLAKRLVETRAGDTGLLSLKVSAFHIGSKIVESITGLANNSVPLSRCPMRCVPFVCDLIVQALFPVQSAEGKMSEMESAFDEDLERTKHKGVLPNIK